MTTINSENYVERKVPTARKNNNSKGVKRNWWLIKPHRTIGLGRLFLPAKFIGKRIRLKVEVIED